MNENTPLLNNSSNGSSNANANGYSANPEQLQQLQQDRHRRGVFMKPKIHKCPGGDYDEFDEAWMQEQRKFIERAGTKPSLKKRIKFDLDTSKKGRFWELFDVIMSMTFVFLYIWNTQYVKIDQDPIPYPRIYQNADLIIACIILVQYIPHIWLADEPLQSFISVYSVLTWLSVFPVIAASIITIFDDEIDNTYMGAGILYGHHDNVEHLSFMDTFFFTVDIVPDNTFTRIVILYVMIAGAVFLPSNLSELLDLIRQRSKYSRPYKPEFNMKHILVTGDFDGTSLYEFLREFFCQDHGLDTMNTEVVVLNPEEPEDDIALLLEDPAFTTRVQYVKGSTTSRQSLEKVRLDIASVVFILSKKFSKNDDEDDAAQILRTLAIKKYNNKIPLYAQIHLPENVPHFDFLANDVICIDEIAMGLMAQSLIIPGFYSLIVLLTTSVTKKVTNNLISSAKKKQGLHWALEYINGINQEIYAVTFSKDFIGKTFLECSELVYNRLGAVLFSIGIYRITQSSKEPFKQLPPNASPFQIFLNPQDYVIEGNEIGFVICDNAEITIKMARFVEHVQTPYKYTSLSFITQSAHDLFAKKNGENRNINDDTQTENNLDHTKLKIKATVDDIDDGGEPSDLQSNVIDSEIIQNNIDNAAAYCFNEKSEIPHVKDHVLICNYSENFPANLDIFMMVLRGEKTSTKHSPIVILSPNEPDDYQKRSLSKFNPVHFINGSPLRRKDLYKARVNYANKCIVLSDSCRYEEASNGTADAVSIMIALNIESMAANEECFVVVECIYRETFKMIGESDSVKNEEDDYAIVKRLIFSHDPDNKMSTPKFNNAQDDEWQSLKISSGHMYQIDIPSSFIEHKAVSLGLYRLTRHEGGYLRYIYVNPKTVTILRNDDRPKNNCTTRYEIMPTKDPSGL
ncbi:9829_t:CDS:10 [Entrophospora sp. SA101]|nr:9829_t:CDS:10 [Entrophospora sp. SA101]